MSPPWRAPWFCDDLVTQTAEMPFAPQGHSQHCVTQHRSHVLWAHNVSTKGASASPKRRCQFLTYAPMGHEGCHGKLFTLLHSKRKKSKTTQEAGVILTECKQTHAWCTVETWTQPSKNAIADWMLLLAGNLRLPQNNPFQIPCLWRRGIDLISNMGHEQRVSVLVLHISFVDFMGNQSSAVVSLFI